MHKDTQEALERLERELLAEEQPEAAEEEELDRMLDDFLWEDDDEEEYPNYANGYRAYNADRPDLDMDHYSDAVYEEPRKGHPGLWIAAALLAGLAAGIAVYWKVMTP